MYSVQRTMSLCFAVLSQWRQIRRLVTPAMFQKLVVVLVFLCLDYGNGKHCMIAAQQSSWKTISAALTFVDDDDDGMLVSLPALVPCTPTQVGTECISTDGVSATSL